MMSKIISFTSGIIFGVGLSVSNMINPEKVLGFLDLFGQWDPSLIFVMIGAIIVSAPVFFLFKNKNKVVNNFLMSFYNIFFLFLIAFIEMQQLFCLSI